MSVRNQLNKKNEIKSNSTASVSSLLSLQSSSNSSLLKMSNAKTQLISSDMVSPLCKRPIFIFDLNPSKMLELIKELHYDWEEIGI
jgi:hypothetical protein